MARIFPPRSMFLNVSVADIHDPDTGESFEAVLINGVTPAIRSKQSGRWCAFDFRELVDLAKSEGIDAPEEQAA